MTEPGAGSDLAGMRSNAQDMGDHWLLNGSKTYISNGINADVVVVAAKVAGAEKAHSMVLLIVERGMEGFERGRNLKKMGLPAQDMPLTARSKLTETRSESSRSADEWAETASERISFRVPPAMILRR